MESDKVIDKKFKEHISSVVRQLEKKERVLSDLLMNSRQLVRMCSTAINDIHKKDYNEAEKKVKEIEKQLKQLPREEFNVHVSHIAQEYTEAYVLLSIVKGRRVPTAEEMGVETHAYLTGLLDCVGELRRELLESLIADDTARAQYIFNVMEDMFGTLSAVHFSSAVLQGYRGKLDTARRQVEQARSELFLAKVKGGNVVKRKKK